MGNFYTCTQILNDQPLSKEDFLKKFCEAMKQEGYAVCEDGEGEMEYSFSFADEKGCRWATLYSESYEEGNQTAKADTARIAGMLGRFCINTTVIDSDCAILELYDKSGSKVDNLIMGRADDYFGDNIPEPERTLWEPLLNNGVDWEQFIEIVHGDYVFVEEGLVKLSGVLNNGSMFNEVLESDCSMAFEKARPKITVTSNGKTIDSDKKVTLNSVFVDVFKNDLEALGFKKAKGSNPAFIKMLGEDVFAVITCYKEAGSASCKPVLDLSSQLTTLWEKKLYDDKLEHFNVLIGIHTVYDEYVDFKVNRENRMSFFSNMKLYSKLNEDNLDMKFRASIFSFTYNSEYEETLYAAMKYVLELSRKYMFWIVDEINDIKSFILFHRGFLLFPFNENIYFIFDDYESFFEKECQIINDRAKQEIENRNFTDKRKSKEYKEVQQVQTKRIERYRKIRSNQKLYAETMKKLEDIKERNISQLKKLGIEIEYEEKL